VLCSLDSDDDRLLPGRLFDISCQGVKLLLSHWREDRPQFTVLVDPKRGFAPYSFRVRVVRVGRQAMGDSLLGCQIVPPLSDADMKRFFEVFPA
jgi:PilZ domain